MTVIIAETREELISICLDEARAQGGPGGNGARNTCIAHSLRGNVLFTLFEEKACDGDVEKRIVIFRISKDRDTKKWKAVAYGESGAPAKTYNCPLRYLKEANVCQDRAWRKHVKDHHERRKSVPTDKLFPGDVVFFERPYTASKAGAAYEFKSGKIISNDKRGYLVDLRDEDFKPIKLFRRDFSSVIPCGSNY